MLSDEFHDFVADSSILEPTERPSAYELLNSHPFIRQFTKKTGGDKAKNQSESMIASFWSGIKNKKSTSVCKIETNLSENSSEYDSAEQELSKFNIGDIEWLF